MMQKIFDQLSPRTILSGIFFIFLGPFLLVEIFPSQLDRVMDKDSYLVFHNIAEFFSIMVSLSVFGVGWFTYDQSRDRHALFLSTAMLAVGLLDFMHTLSNAAMPAFLTPNSTNKSTQFWIAARLFDATAFAASAYIYPGSQGRWLSKKTLLTSALIVTGLIFTGVVFFPSYLPATAVPGVGLTPLKRYLEYLVILLLTAAAFAYWKRMQLTGDRALIYYPAAFIICAFSEGVFASYKTGFDTYNVLGHIYKIVAFYLIYQGIFATSVKKPYIKILDAHKKLRAEAVSRHELEKEIEERKRAEEALRESETKYRNLFEYMIDGFALHQLVVDETGKPVDYIFQEVNKAFERLTGLGRTEIINRPVTEVIPGIKDDPADWIGTYGKVALTGQEARFEQRAMPLGRWYSVLAYCPMKGYFVTLFEDITERKRAEQALKESERKYRFLTENMKDVAWILDPETLYFRYVSPSVLHLRGFTAEEVLARPVDDALTPEGARYVRNLMQERIATFRSGAGRDDYYTEDIEQPRRDGSTVWTEVITKYLLNEETGKIEIHGVTREITERRKAEEALQKAHAELAAANKELEAFAYSVSHDLRAPLRTIDGFSRALLEDYGDKLDREGAEHLARVQSAAARMGRLIDAMLSLSRMTRGELRRELVDVSAMARGIAAELKQSDPNRNIEFKIAGSVSAEADPIMLRVLLENLLENAWKFTCYRNPAVIELGVMSSEFGEKTVPSGSELRTPDSEPVYYARDNGAGFDMAYADKLFLPFQRLHSASEFPGIGIGLATVQRIVHRHGGKIRAEGKPDEGAAFYFTL